MKIGVNIGHYGTVGAEGILSEVKCNTEIYNQLIPMLEKVGYEIIPCNVAKAPDYVSATTFANTQDLDLLISIHNNSHPNVSANGTEVLYYTGNEETKVLAEKISLSISSKLGTRSRGAVPRNNIHIISRSKAPCVLIEGFFVSNKEDCAKYNPHTIALGIAEVFGYVKSTELVTPNDIVWELGHRGIVTDKQGMLDEISKDPNGRLYWLARKTANMTVNK